MNYRAACHSPSIFLGICLLGSDFICCAARAGWAPLTREVGDSTSGLCRQFPAESGDSPAPSCPVCPIISWTTNTTPEAALKAELVHLHSLLIFLSFWLCCRSKILFAGHHLASLAPGQQVSLCNRTFAPNQRHSQGQEHPGPNCGAQRGCCGSGWVSYSLPVRHGSDSPSISQTLGDYIPPAHNSTSTPHKCFPAAASLAAANTHYPGTLLLTKTRV